jgi:hypothetical protein
MYVRIDNSNDKTPPQDENDKLPIPTPITDESFGIEFIIQNNDFSKTFQELYEKNEPNSILNAYVFTANW